MDKVNFLATDDYPVATDTLDLMQRMTFLSAQTALLGGNNYILQGCTEDADGNVSNGIIVINGELLPFTGGQKKDKITINEIKTTLEAFDQEYREAEIIRSATFDDDGKYNWNDFKQVLTNLQIQEKINSIRSETPGFVNAWSGRIDRIPENYLLCDGSLVKTVDFPDLAYMFGKENVESFELPNLKQRFIVGYDAENQDYSPIGKTGGKETVKLTIDQMPNHAHGIKFTENKWGDNANSRPFPDATGSAGYTAQTEAVGGSQEHENRPPYYVLAYVIKVKY